MRENAPQLVFFSSYPSKGIVHDAKIVGGAAYTKKLLISLKQAQPSLSLTVYAERFAGTPLTSYHDEGVFVKRVWQRNRWHSIWKAISLIARETAGTVAVSYEINMVGGPLANIFFLSSLLFLKLKGKRLVFIPHQVVGSFDAVEENRLKAAVLNCFKNLLFSYITALADTVVVFEKKLASYLPYRRKVHVVPLAVEELRRIDRQAARRKLGLDEKEFTILYFGFLSPYKGIDSLLEIYTPAMGKLIVAGDGNPNHMNSSAYRAFVRSVKEAAREKNALTTGFVPEELIPYYYAACDLVVLPYRIFFSSSYPLAFAFSHEKPFIVSKALSGYFGSDDVRAALLKTGLNPRQFTFAYNAKDLAEKIHEIKMHAGRFSRFSRLIKEGRSWPSVARKYLEIFNIM